MKDLTLYGVSNKFENLVELINRDVLEDWEVQKLKETIAEEIKASSIDIIKHYINEMADIETLATEIKRLQILKSSKTANVEKFKDRLTENMRSLSVSSIKTPLGNVTLSLNGTNKSVELDENTEIDSIPEVFVKVKKELNKTEIKNAIKNGESIKGINIIETPSRVSFRLAKNTDEEAGE